MSDFNWVEGTTTVAQIVKSLAIDLTTASEHKWSCKNPANVGDITNKVILETETSFGQKFYLKIERAEAVLNYILLTLGNKYSTETEDIDETVSNEPVRFAWYRQSEEIELFEWAGVQYWLSFSEDFINVVLQGDPSLDVAPYNNYLISYGYIGSLESFEGGDSDTTYNFGITVSSNVFPEEMSSKYGVRTASCITDVGMIGTRTGTPFQAHLPKFSTSWEYADRNFISSSQWPHKYHITERELKLWSRFWFLYAGSEKDNKIIPCCDYPYEEEPIEFEGFEDLIPKNYHSVYPNNFNKIIDRHPVSEGKELGLKEIPLSINIMVEIINILIMLWVKYYRAFWGWTGSQAVWGITNNIFEWLTLESSRLEQENKESKEHYDRCYRWLRWEAEKMILMARNDIELRGNYYVGLYLEELINYMQEHHFDTMPIFRDLNKMDEWRGVFGKDLEKDITWILDKVKRNKT